MNAPPWRRVKLGGTAVLGMVILYIGYQAVSTLLSLNDPRNQAFWQWWSGDTVAREALMTVQDRAACGGAPFILPADGFIGLLYRDPRGPYSRLNPHQGIDIFSNSDVGETPVYAAYDGYVSRLSDWQSSLIQRVPDDPLNPGEQIWLYYTHMADRDGNDFIEDVFEPGSREVFVEQGTLLGYTGNYSGNPIQPTGIHLHFSIVEDDGNGRFLNELEFSNTKDPSPYLGIAVDYRCGTIVMACTAVPQC